MAAVPTFTATDESNPYLGLTLEALERAALARAECLLLEGIQRTPSERRALAHDTAHLLRMLARHHCTSPHQIGNPELFLLSGSQSRGLAASCLQWHERERMAMRQRTLARAANFALGPSAGKWLHACSDRALSDEAMQDGLAQLERISSDPAAVAKWHKAVEHYP